MNRTIIISENQAYWLGLLSEDDGDSEIFDGTDNTEYIGTEKISPNATITSNMEDGENFQGEDDYGSPITSDKLEKQIGNDNPLNRYF